MDNQYYVFQCPKCGVWRAKETRIGIEKTMFKCWHCNKTCKIKKKNQFGLALKYKGPYNSPVRAMKTAKEENLCR